MIIKSNRNIFMNFLHNVFNIYGRTNRTNYNYIMIPFMLKYILIIINFQFISPYRSVTSQIFSFFSLIVFWLLYLILGFSISARRNRDAGLSKWFIILLFIPNIHILYSLVLMIIPSKSNI